MISLLCVERIRTHRHDECFLLSNEFKIARPLVRKKTANDDVYLWDGRTRERERERESHWTCWFNSQDRQIEHCLAELDTAKQIVYQVICVDWFGFFRLICKQFGSAEPCDSKPRVRRPCVLWQICLGQIFANPKLTWTRTREMRVTRTAAVAWELNCSNSFVHHRACSSVDWLDVEWWTSLCLTVTFSVAWNYPRDWSSTLREISLSRSQPGGEEGEAMEWAFHSMLIRALIAVAIWNWICVCVWGSLKWQIQYLFFFDTQKDMRTALLCANEQVRTDGHVFRVDFSSASDANSSRSATATVEI